MRRPEPRDAPDGVYPRARVRAGSVDAEVVQRPQRRHVLGGGRPLAGLKPEPRSSRPAWCTSSHEARAGSPGGRPGTAPRSPIRGSSRRPRPLQGQSSAPGSWLAAYHPSHCLRRIYRPDLLRSSITTSLTRTQYIADGSMPGSHRAACLVLTYARRGRTSAVRDAGCSGLPRHIPIRSSQNSGRRVPTASGAAEL